MNKRCKKAVGCWFRIKDRVSPHPSFSTKFFLAREHSEQRFPIIQSELKIRCLVYSEYSILSEFWCIVRCAYCELETERLRPHKNQIVGSEQSAATNVHIWRRAAPIMRRVNVTVTTYILLVVILRNVQLYITDNCSHCSTQPYTYSHPKPSPYLQLSFSIEWDLTRIITSLD